MQAAHITEERSPGAPLTATAMASTRTGQQVRHLTGHPLPVRILAMVRSSWEEVLVAAGLDRESRELSPAESGFLVPG